MRHKSIFSCRIIIIVCIGIVLLFSSSFIGIADSPVLPGNSGVTTYDTFIHQRYHPIPVNSGCSSCAIGSSYSQKQSGTISLVSYQDIQNGSVPIQSTGSKSGEDDISSFTVLQFTPEEMTVYKERYLKNTLAPAPFIGDNLTLEQAGEMSLLPFLTYNPVEQDQKNCNNCWIWAGTGIMTITLNKLYAIEDRISVQYPTSTYRNGGLSPFSGDDFACVSGGSINDFTSFYLDKGLYGGKLIIIPWSNINAAFKDSNGAQIRHTVVPPDSISKNSYYQIQDLIPMTISTLNIPQATAITNLKYQINAGRGVYLSFWLPDTIAWDDFKNFWKNQQETAVYQIDAFSKTPYNYNEGGGHAVLVTGYHEYTDGSGYWECVNSWGAPSNRPSGTFRIDMNMDYNSRYQNIDWPVTMWETIDARFSVTPTPTVTPMEPLTAEFIASPKTGTVPLNVWFEDRSTGTPDSWQWDYGDGTSGTSKNGYHIYENTGTYSVTLNVFRSSETATISKNNLISVTGVEPDVVPFPNVAGGSYPQPHDLTGDGLYEDIDGNGFLGFQDVTVFFEQIGWAQEHEPVSAFDFDKNGFLGFQDIVTLFGMI